MMGSESSLINQARSLIDAVKGNRLSLEQRTEAAIELAGILLQEARRIERSEEKHREAQLAHMIQDPIGKGFTIAVTDQCFRSKNPYRIADQLKYVIQKYQIPSYLSLFQRMSLETFKWIGKPLAGFLVPLTVRLIRQEASQVIFPAEGKELAKDMKRCQQEGVRINLNHLGEAVLGEQEAEHRLQIYLEDLANPLVEYISVKISTIYSQINLSAWEGTLHALANRLRPLYLAAMQNEYVRADGSRGPKFVNLDMEEYRDLRLTVALFRKVLDEPEFYHCSAGIVLQSYLPDSFLIQQELTIWARQRLAQGGAPIKIRLVKGANLAMEQVEAAIRLWPQAPYTSKGDADANYKRMINYAFEREHVYAAHVGVASHNLFDIAYALLLRAENGVEKEVSFEMLQGMADHMRRVVQQVSGEILLYHPVAAKEEFQNAVAYLIRRLDENTAPENFLRQAFNLTLGSPQWQSQAERFREASLFCHSAGYVPRRTQNRWQLPSDMPEMAGFKNEADTDWSLPQNCKWAEKILRDWSQKKIKPIPIVIGGDYSGPDGHVAYAYDPSRPRETFYQYRLATNEDINRALEVAKQTEASWSQTSIQERAMLMHKIAQLFRLQRSELIGAMSVDTGKTVAEADSEVSEAIDFAEYYRQVLEELSSMPDIKWKAKGTALVAPPWNFPCSIPAGGALAALAAGNCVIFKPAAESVLVGWKLAQIFWEAGVSSCVLQFITCEDDPIGSQLIKDPRVNLVLLTGATATAKLFLRLRPDLDLIAETGGKNTMVITAMSDRDLAIKDLIQSAFGYAGQKCSACSLAILEAEVYDDPHFRKQLRDAAASLPVGSAWNPQTRINPLIREPNETLLKGLTVLEEGETWLLEPAQDPNNLQLWSPGIKLGVRPGSFTFQNELFGPVLGLVRADDFLHALHLMNQTAYGLTAGIHSLDEREQQVWLKQIEAGNCYINRTITGAIVQRQPFGGCKDSGFGRGAKAGGPNYLTQLMCAEQVALPKERELPNQAIAGLTEFISIQDREAWEASIGSYTFYWNHYFSKKHDPSLVLGQDNFQCYVPHPPMDLRVQAGDSALDVFRVIAAAMTCGTSLCLSEEGERIQSLLHQVSLPLLSWVKESEEEFSQRIKQGKVKRLRLLKPVSAPLQEALAHVAVRLNSGCVLANGRLELLHYLREMSISYDYHRYGNLGDREKEKRTLLIGSPGTNCVASSQCQCVCDE